MRPYLGRLAAELDRVGIGGSLRARILTETADHLADGEEAEFGEPATLARQFADELATDRTRRAAFVSFGALAATGVGFAAAWLLLGRAGWRPGERAGWWTPLGLAGALGMIVFPQFAFAAGLVMILRAFRRRRDRRLPASEIGLLLRRTRAALAFGGLTVASALAYVVAFHGRLATWYAIGVPAGALVLAAGLGAAAVQTRSAAVVKSAVPGDAGDVFDDLPVDIGRNTRLLVGATTLAVVLAALVAGGVTNEGPRNAVAEIVLVAIGWFSLGRRLGLRR